MAKLYKDPVSFEWFEVEEGQEEAAAQAGLVPVTEDDKKVAQKIDEFKSKPLPALRVFAAQFLDEAAMGLPEAFIDSATNDPFFLEAKERIKDEYELANILGGLTGFGASMLYGGPIGKIATAGAGRVATNIVAKTAIAGAAEGAIYGGATSLAEAAGRTYAYFSEGKAFDPEAAAEVFLSEMMKEVGDTLETTAIGAGAGASFGVLSTLGGRASKVWQRVTGKGKGKTIPNLDFNSASLGETAYIAEAGEDLLYKRLDELGAAIAAGNTPAAEAIQQDIIRRSKSRLTKNANEVVEAYKALDLELIPESLLKNDDPLKVYYTERIAETAGEAGKIKQAQIGSVFKKMQSKIEEKLDFATLSSKDPQSLLFEQKTKIADAIADAGASFAKAYDEIRPLWEATVDEAGLRKITKAFEDLAEEYAFDMKLSPMLNRLKGFLEDRVTERGGMKLGDAQKVLRSLTNFYNEAAPSEINRIIAKLKGTIDSVIEDVATKSGLEKELLLKKAIDSEYRAFKEGLDVIGQKLADIPTQTNRTVLRESFSSLTDDELRQALLGKKGAALRETLKKMGLESVIHEAAKVDFFKRAYRGAVGEDFNIRSLVNKLKDYEDMAGLTNLFGEDAGKLLKSMVTVVDSLPSNYTDPRFTSNTNKILRELRDGKSLVGRLGDLALQVKDKGFSLGAAADIFRGAVSKSEINLTEKLLKDTMDFGLGLRVPELKKDISGIYGMVKTMGKKGRAIRSLIEQGFQDGGSIESALRRYYQREAHGEEKAKERIEQLKRQKQVLSSNIDKVIEEVFAVASNPDALLSDGAFSSLGEGLDVTRMGVLQRVASMIGTIYQAIPKTELIESSDVKSLARRMTDADKQRIVDSLVAVLNPDVTMAKIVTAQATPSEMIAFRSAYPKLAEELAARLSSKSGGRLSQKTKIILSYLGARPLDLTLSPHRVTRVTVLPSSEEPVKNKPIIKGKFAPSISDSMRIETRGIMS